MRTAALIGTALTLGWGGSSLAEGPVSDEPDRPPNPPFSRKLRGMTVSCPIYGQIWGRTPFSHALSTLREEGVEWVALHPYARVARDGEVSFTPPAETGYLPSAVERARRAGMHLFWKPHLAYWGSFEWRGAIDFGDDEAAWDRFFRTYRSFILAHARFSARAGIPLLAVATELERMTRYEARWRSLIAEVREIYPGRITWAANWDGVGAVPFWDALDYIGVQAYFPLEVDGSRPTPEQIDAAWQRGPLPTLAALAERVDRPVLFTEIGYPDAAHAARTPWKPERSLDPSAPRLRTRLIEGAARTLEHTPFVAGMFWWKWIPGRPSGDFSMRAEPARRALGSAWRPPTTPVTAAAAPP